MLNRDILKIILSYTKPYKKTTLIALFALIIVVFSMLMIGQSIKKFIDEGFANIENGSESLNSIIFLVILFGIGSFTRSYLVNITAEKVSNDVKKRAFFNLSLMSLEHISKYDYSDLSDRVNRDSEFVSRVIIDMSSFFIRNFLVMIGSLSLMIIVAPKLSSISLIILVLIAFSVKKVARNLRNLSIDSEKLRVNVSNIVNETIFNNKVIATFSRYNSVNQYFSKLNQLSLDKNFQRLKIRSIFFASTVTFTLLSVIFILWFGSREVAFGNMTSGSLAAFIFYSIMMATSLGGVIELFGELQKNLANCERVFEISEFKVKIDDYNANNSSKLTDSQNLQNTYFNKIDLSKVNKIKFKDIGFSYSSGDKFEKEFSLKNINFEINLGKFYGIKGRSGVGKTTIIQILLGLLKPTSGSIILDDNEFKFLDPKNWEGQIAYVPQDSNLFTGTIIDNLYFFSENRDLKEVDYIIDNLDLREYIDSLEDGLNSKINNLATNLSGGQKQRIAIARAILSKPEILILDESTSNLDIQTELKIIDFIRKYMKNKTIISIAHRPNAIKDADEIIEM